MAMWNLYKCTSTIFGQNGRKVYSLMSLVFLVGVSFNLIGCVPLPSTRAFEKRPFEGEQTSSIIVGVTTKGEVEHILGTPDAARRDGSVYIYEKSYLKFRIPNRSFWGIRQRFLT